MRKRWKVLLGTVGGIALLAVLTGAWLFSGSEVVCEERSEANGFALHCPFTVAAPPEEVWKAFTETGVPRPYYFDAVLQARLGPGGPWRFVTDDLERLLAGGTVLATSPPHHFEHTFEAADLQDPPSRIQVEIQPTPEGSQVTLIHDQFQTKTETYRRFSKAHPLALNSLKTYLEEGKLPLKARLYTALFKPGMKYFTEKADPWPSSTPTQD